MDEVDELLSWLLQSNLITLDTVRTWNASADLALENGVRSLRRLDALRVLVGWYDDHKRAAEVADAAIYDANIAQWRKEQEAQA